MTASRSLPRDLRALRPALLVLCTLLAWAVPPGMATAQDISVAGVPDSVRVLIDRVLADDAFTLIDRDTILGPEFIAYGDLVVVDAEVVLEGEVRGDALVLGGVLHLRPNASVAGAVLVVGGLFLPSAHATHGQLREIPGELLELRGDVDRGFHIDFLEAPAPRSPPRVVLPGVFGLRIPTYQRVDAVTLAWGPQWRPAGHLDGVVVDATVSYFTARGDFGGRVHVDAPLGRGVRLAVGAERATRTPDEWIRGDLTNSLIHLWNGGDVRNYHESDRAYLEVERPLPFLTLRGWTGGPFVRLEVSEDRSLAESRTWSLLGDSESRRNPPVFEGRLASATVGGQGRWSGASSRIELYAAVERGLEIERVGEWAFTQWVTDGALWMEALWGHTLKLRGRAMGTVGGVAAPPQRWSHVGGGGTLPTIDEAAIDGDNLLFVDSRYFAPVPLLRIPHLGPPELALAHLMGTAWPTGLQPTLEQAVGVGVRVLALAVFLYIDPAVGWREGRILAEISLPGSF